MLMDGLSETPLCNIEAKQSSDCLSEEEQKSYQNSITRPEEVPDRTEEFERDFAYWVQENEKFVKFRILVASSVPQYKLFKTARYSI